MSTKGTKQTTITKFKISSALQSNRTKVLEKLKEYKNMIVRDDTTLGFPSIVSACLYAGMSKRAVLQWELETAEDSELRQILEFIRDLEEMCLRNFGLSGVWDSKLVSRLLEAEHGIAPKPTQLTQNNTFNISPELLAEAIELSRSKKKA